MRIEILLLLAACNPTRDPSVRSSEPAPPALSPPARWIDKTWLGPAIINAGPQITLCGDGHYRKTAPFAASPGASGFSADRGMACCTDSESGTYELDRDPRGTIVAVRFTPGGTTAPYSSPITDGDHLEGYRAAESAMRCR